ENRLPAQTTFDAPAEEEPSAPSTERRQATVISSVAGGAPTGGTQPLPHKTSIPGAPLTKMSGAPAPENFFARMGAGDTTPHSPASVGSLSSPAIRASPTRDKPSM